jgi:phosphomannomutase
MMLLEMLATERVSVNELLRRLTRQFGPHHYARLDTHFPLEKRAALMEYCKACPPAKLAGSPLGRVNTEDGVKFIAQNGAWLMLRGSGTEPVLRIYAEARSDALARQLIADGVRITRRV